MFIPGDLVNFRKMAQILLFTNTIKSDMKEDWIWPQMYFRILLSPGVFVSSQFLGMQARFKEGQNLSLTHTHKKLCPDICA